jgi:hypothetical protein
VIGRYEVLEVLTNGGPFAVASHDDPADALRDRDQRRRYQSQYGHRQVYVQHREGGRPLEWDDVERAAA